MSDVFFGYSILNYFVSIRSDFLNNLFIIITDLGSMQLYLILFSFFFLIFEDRITLKLLTLLIISYLTNSILKNIFKFPRPDEKIVKPIYTESGGGYGFPSGHSQNSTVLWIGLYLTFRKNYLMIISIVLITLISISRLYLGLHFLFDVVGGIFIGLLILLFCFKYMDKFIEKLLSLNFGIILIVSIILLLSSFFIKEFSLILNSFSGILIGINLTKNFDYVKLDFKKVLYRIFICYSIFFCLIYLIKITNLNFIYFFIGLWITYFSRLIFRKIGI